jgi:hypothetical protein
VQALPDLRFTSSYPMPREKVKAVDHGFTVRGRSGSSQERFKEG